MSEKSGSLRDTLRMLRPLLPRRDKRRMLALLLAMFVAAVLETVSLGSVPAFLSLLVDPERTLSALPGQIGHWVSGFSTDVLILWGAVALVLIFVIKNLYLAGVIWMTAVVLRDISTGISKRLFAAYMRGAYSLHLQRNSASTIRNLITESGQLRVTLNGLLLAMRETLVLILLSLVLILADPAISIPTVLFLSLTATTAFLFIRRRMAQGGQIVQDLRGQQMQMVQQSIGALKVARVLGHEADLIRQFNTTTSALEHISAVLRFLPASPRLILEVVAIATLLLIISLSLGLGRPTAEILPILVLISVSIVRLVPVLTQIASATSQLAVGRAAIRVISSDLATFEAAAAAQPKRADRAAQRPEFTALKLKSLSFTFPGTETPTLQDISLTIAPGQSVGLIGPSGSGKSTLVDIVMGLGQPDQGEVLLDGRNVHQDRSALQNLFGYVPQDIYLLDDTIRQNIGFGIPAADLDPSALERCLEDAQLTEFVDSLPNGLDTVIGDRGARLSGGQRQRLGIARALYHNPAILVLDEATSALDTATEEAVTAAIKALKGQITTLTIAHRLTTLQDCDVVYRIDAGRVVTQGNLRDVAPTSPQIG